MTTIREAIAELEEVAAFLGGIAPMEGHSFSDDTTPKYWWRAPLRAAVAKVRAALAAAPEAEPVAWQVLNNGQIANTFSSRVKARTYAMKYEHGTYRALYTAPPLRTPLTETEIDAIFDARMHIGPNDVWRREIARAILAAAEAK